jgi:hypothetical protein
MLIRNSHYMIAGLSTPDGHVHGQAYKTMCATILGPLASIFLLLVASDLPLSERTKTKQLYEQDSNRKG